MMKNKKGTGIQWLSLLLALLLGAAAITLSDAMFSSMPTAGSFADKLNKRLRYYSDAPILIHSIMDDIAKRSIDIKTKTNPDLTQTLFLESFEENYGIFKTTEIKNFNYDFSKVDYEFKIEEESGEFFLIGKSDDKVLIPWTKDSEGIKGNISINPSFKIKLDHDFVSI